MVSNQLISPGEVMSTQGQAVLILSTAGGDVDLDVDTADSQSACQAAL